MNHPKELDIDPYIALLKSIDFEKVYSLPEYVNKEIEENEETRR